jgi:hypothetical protein
MAGLGTSCVDASRHVCCGNTCGTRAIGLRHKLAFARDFRAADATSREGLIRLSRGRVATSTAVSAREIVFPGPPAATMAKFIFQSACNLPTDVGEPCHRGWGRLPRALMPQLRSSPTRRPRTVHGPPPGRSRRRSAHPRCGRPENVARGAVTSASLHLHPTAPPSPASARRRRAATPRTLQAAGGRGAQTPRVRCRSPAARPLVTPPWHATPHLARAHRHHCLPSPPAQAVLPLVLSPPPFPPPTPTSPPSAEVQGCLRCACTATR